MKSKLLQCVILIAALLLLNVILHQINLPQKSTELALQQMGDNNSSARLRVIEQLSNWITPVLVLVGIIGSVIIMRSPKTEPEKNVTVETEDINL